MVEVGVLCISVLKAVIALTMKTCIGSPHPCMGTGSQCLQEELLQVEGSPLNQAPLPELGSELRAPTELHANLPHNQSVASLCKASQHPLQT